MQSNSFPHLRPQARVMLILAVLLAVVAGVRPSISRAENGWTLLKGMVTVIYDNQFGADETADPSTSIGGGSVGIHK